MLQINGSVVSYNGQAFQNIEFLILKIEKVEPTWSIRYFHLGSKIYELSLYHTK